MSRIPWWARYLGVAALLAAVIVARRPDAVTMPQFWAEDGTIFFRENLTLGFPAALAKGYRGFPYLTHRLIACAAGVVPLASEPRVYTTTAIALTALALATFALPSFRHLVRSDGLRVLFGVLALSAPFDQEVLATPTNVGWFIAVWLSLISLMQLPGARWRLVAVLMLAIGAVFSTPLAVVNVPIWIVRAVGSLRGRARGPAAFWIGLLVAQGIVLALAQWLGAHTRVIGGEILSWSTVAFVLDRFVGVVWPMKGGMLRLGVAWVLAGWGIVLAAFVGAAAAARFRTLGALTVVLYLHIAAGLCYAVGRPTLLLIVSEHVADRYAIFSTAMFALAVVVALDGLHALRVRRVATALAVGVLVLAWWPTFRIAPLQDVRWPLFAARLEQRRATGSRAPLSIPGNPTWAPIEFDPVDWWPPERKRPDAIVAGLGSHGRFRVRFRCECAGLAAVELRLTAAARSSRGGLMVTLVDDAEQTVAASRKLSRSEMALDGGAEVVTFEALAHSAGKRYTLMLQAVENDAEATIYVKGWAADHTPDESIFGGQVIAGDAAFRHGCIRPTP